MKVGVVGSSGYISSYLLKKFKEVQEIDDIVKIGRSKDDQVFLDLENAEAFDDSVFGDLDFLVFTAAVKALNVCENEHEKCWSINVIGTEYIIKKALQHHCKVIFFSSDTVYGADQSKIYDESSETLPVSAYGKMKKTVEDLFKTNPLFKVIRPSYVVSHDDPFSAYCFDCIKQHNEAEIFHPYYRNCISVYDIVNVVLWLINHWDEYDFFALNVAGKELVSKIRIADELNRHLGNVLKYKIIRPDNVFYKSHPAVIQMKSLYLSQYNIIEDNTFTEKIKKVLEEI